MTDNRFNKFRVAGRLQDGMGGSILPDFPKFWGVCFYCYV